jgi:hypothetical protein
MKNFLSWIICWIQWWVGAGCFRCYLVTERCVIHDRYIIIFKISDIVLTTSLYWFMWVEIWNNVFSLGVSQLWLWVVFRITGLADFVHRPDSKQLEEKHYVSETVSVSVLRWGKTPTLLGSLERVSETSCFSSNYLEYQTMDKVRKPSNSVIHHRQNPIESTWIVLYTKKWHLVVRQKFTDVSEKYTAFIFRVEK